MFLSSKWNVPARMAAALVVAAGIRFAVGVDSGRWLLHRWRCRSLRGMKLSVSRKPSFRSGLREARHRPQSSLMTGADAREQPVFASFRLWPTHCRATEREFSIGMTIRSRAVPWKVNNKIGALQRAAYLYRDQQHFILKLFALHEAKFKFVFSRLALHGAPYLT